MSPKVWLITGASSGMGRAMTEYVLGQGDIAVATLRKPEVISDLTRKYGKDKLLVVKVDVTKVQDITDAFAMAKQVFGRIDVVYNNAGFGALGEIEGLDLDVARAVFDVNFWGATSVAREAVRFFRDENKPAGGNLINVSSTVSVRAVPDGGFYSASKFALNGVLETLAQEISPSWNIKLVIVILGGFLTRGIKENMVQTPIHPAYDDPSLAPYQMRHFFTKEYDAPGDPSKASRQIYKLAKLENPPLFFPLGQDAPPILEAKAKLYVEAAEQWKSWSDDVNRD